MVASHDYGPAAVLSFAAWGENGVHIFPILDQAGICGYVERGA